MLRERSSKYCYGGHRKINWPAIGVQYILAHIGVEVILVNGSSSLRLCGCTRCLLRLLGVLCALLLATLELSATDACQSCAIAFEDKAFNTSYSLLGDYLARHRVLVRASILRGHVA